MTASSAASGTWANPGCVLPSLCCAMGDLLRDAMRECNIADAATRRAGLGALGGYGVGLAPGTGLGALQVVRDLRVQHVERRILVQPHVLHRHREPGQHVQLTAVVEVKLPQVLEVGKVLYAGI